MKTDHTIQKGETAIRIQYGLLITAERAKSSPIGQWISTIAPYMGPQVYVAAMMLHERHTPAVILDTSRSTYKIFYVLRPNTSGLHELRVVQLLVECLGSYDCEIERGALPASLEELYLVGGYNHPFPRGGSTTWTVQAPPGE